MYTTRDFYFSALLITHRFDLVDSEKHNDGVHFIFKVHDEDLLNKLQNDFNTLNAYVNMNKFVKATARLRKELDRHKNK
ncbi:MAG: hypothetical protein PHY30_03640 [Candidatus Pacebacteria bacterium]|nr:hypothetical protein [Candidatus Paceibacterota bacterium]